MPPPTTRGGEEAGTGRRAVDHRPAQRCTERVADGRHRAAPAHDLASAPFGHEPHERGVDRRERGRAGQTRDDDRDGEPEPGPARGPRAAWPAPGARRARAATANDELVPWTRPPITEPPAQSAIIQPTSAECPASLSVATSDTSVPTSTKAAATPASSTTSRPGVSNRSCVTSSATGAETEERVGGLAHMSRRPDEDGEHPDDGQGDGRRRLRREEHPDDRGRA